MDAVSAFILANLPAIICIVVGFALVVLEIFIPGFGAPGIIGIILLIVGIVLKANSVFEGLIWSISIIAILCIVLSIALRSASHGRLSKSPLVLNEVFSKEGTVSSNDLSYFVGCVGITKSILRPAGIAEFDGVKLNVVSEGEFIVSDTTVKVDRVEGNRIVVSKVV